MLLLVTSAGRLLYFLDRTTALRSGSRSARGQVAQVVERSPEKAGVGGSSPSLATIN